MSENTNTPGVPDVEEETNQMATHLLARNMRAVKDATQAQANELSQLRGSIVELHKTLNSAIAAIEQMKQLQLAGLAANRGTGPTS